MTPHQWSDRYVYVWNPSGVYLARDKWVTNKSDAIAVRQDRADALLLTPLFKECLTEYAFSKSYHLPPPHAPPAPAPPPQHVAEAD